MIEEEGRQQQKEISKEMMNLSRKGTTHNELLHFPFSS